MLTNSKRFDARQGSFLATIFRYMDIGADVLLLLMTLALIAAILWSEGVSAATVAEQSYEVDSNNIQSGTLLYQLPNHVGTFAAPTVHTDVQVTVTGDIATIVLEQAFYNPSNQYIEGLYAFPLSEDAAIYGMHLEVDGRIIEGRIQEKAQALKTYEKAKSEGKRASLVQQFRPNIFTTAVANIAAGETVHIVLRYQQMLHYQEFAEQSYYELRIPTAMTPRFTPNNSVNPLQKVSTTAPLGDSELTSSAGNNGSGIAAKDEVNTLNVSTKIVAAEMLREIKSVGYPVVISGPTDDHYEVGFPQPQKADRDYILRWYPEHYDQIKVSLLKENIDREAYYLLTLLPPLQNGSGGHALPREVTYVIDVSGSMEGASLRQAKKALALAISRLRAQDKFNIIKFSDDASALFPQPHDADQDNLAQALHYINALQSEGGTEIESALKLAFSMPSSAGYTGQIVFLTDGSVSNEQQLFSLIEKNLGQRRLFTIGIGSAPNNYFMVKAAQYGRGVYTYIADLNEVEEKMSALFRQLENPALTDIEISGQGAMEFWPIRVPDLYVGQPLTIAIKAERDTTPLLLIKGKHGDSQWQASVDTASALAGKGIARRWARTKIAALMDGLVSGVPEEQVRAAVLPLALKQQLLSNYTSFVAVDVTPVRSEDEKLNALSYADSQPNAAMRLAATATSAPLQFTAGVLLLMLLAGAKFIRRRSVLGHRVN